jgi:hypothetical protein
MFDKIAEQLIAIVISIGSLIFPSIKGTQPVFNELQLVVTANMLYLSTELQDCYTPEFDKVLSSGQAVTLYFQFEIYLEKSERPIIKRDFSHIVRYNPLDRQFELYCSESNTYHYFNSLEQVHANFTRLQQVPLLEAVNLEAGRSYYLRAEAYLADIRLLGEGVELNMMLFWDEKRPVARSGLFDLSFFLY